MRKLLVFENISLDGYFTDANGRMDFAKNVARDEEFEAFVAQNASGGSVLLFGRLTYEMMASFWPTPAAHAMLPEVARKMNESRKIVFSRTLQTAEWSNTSLVQSDAVEYVRRLKEEPGPGLCVLGSGSLVAQLAQAHLVDEYQFVIVPVAVGAGRTPFEGLREPQPMHLTKTRSFNNGNLFVAYEKVADYAADHSVHLV